MLFFELITLMPRWVRKCLLVVCYFVVALWILPLCESFRSFVLGFLPFLLFVFCCAAILVLASYYADKWRELGLRYAEQAKGEAWDSHAVKAAKYFMKSALLFDNTAIVNLGLCYAYGFGVEKDQQTNEKGNKQHEYQIHPIKGVGLCDCACTCSEYS